MARIVHIALKVEDLEKATRFYEDVFGIYQTKTGHARGHTSRHMTDGNIDLALMVYDSEQEAEAQLSGPGPCNSAAAPSRGSVTRVFFVAYLAPRVVVIPCGGRWRDA